MVEEYTKKYREKGRVEAGREAAGMHTTYNPLQYMYFTSFAKGFVDEKNRAEIESGHISDHGPV